MKKIFKKNLIKDQRDTKRFFRYFVVFYIFCLCTSIAMEKKAEDETRYSAQFSYNKNETEKQVVTREIFFPPYPTHRKFGSLCLISERCYLYIEDIKKSPNILLGPLVPCIGIIIKHTPSGKTLIAHKDHAAKLDSLHEICLEKFKGLKDDLTIILYSCVVKTDTKIEVAYKQACNDHSQKEELTITKNFFVQLFNIDRSKVKALLFDLNIKGYQYGDNIDLTSYLLISKDNIIYHFDPYDRDAWGWRLKRPLDSRKKYQKHDLSLRTQVLNEMSPPVKGEEIESYNSKPFYSRKTLDEFIINMKKNEKAKDAIPEIRTDIKQ